jgi:hypothetical protein
MATRIWPNLGASGSLAAFAIDAPAPNSAASSAGSLILGGFAEDSGMNSYQLWALVDAGAVANDVVYCKTYSGAYNATPTVANSSRNEVCGVVTTTVTATQWTFLQQKGVRLVKYTGTAALTAARGSLVVADSVGTNSADVKLLGTAIVLAGNQNTVHFGIAQAVASAGTISTYLNIQPY